MSLFGAAALLNDGLSLSQDIKWQYESGATAIPAAASTEPRVASFGKASVLAAVKYLDDGAAAWAESHSCIACHTTGTYMAERPALTPWLGKPPTTVRENFIAETPTSLAPPPNPIARQQYEDQSGGLVWRSLGLVEWDRHLTGKLSDATDRSLRDMLNQSRLDTGFWPTYHEMEIPYITTEFELSVHGAQAIATAPNWLDQLKDEDMLKRIMTLKASLKAHRPRNNYERVLQLQVASFWPELVSTEHRKMATEMLWDLQNSDGGWSTRRMSTPDNWRDEVIADVQKLLTTNPNESDPYMTSFAVILLRGEKVPASEPRIQKAITWLKREQRVSGRWWMRTMFRETYSYITYIATSKSLTALAACGELDFLKD
jgi:squalene-hopene/tetraprenyl-beta-curcumene cyclase